MQAAQAHNFLILSLVLLALGLMGKKRCPNLPWLTIPYFLIQAPLIELAWVALCFDLVYGLYKGWQGAWQYPAGNLALAITATAAMIKWQIVQAGLQADKPFKSALKLAFGEQYLDYIRPEAQSSLRHHNPAKLWLNPFRMRVAGVEKITNIAYDQDPRHVLDIYRPANTTTLLNDPEFRPLPVLLQVHGGGWTTGHKEQQAQPLMNYLASKGWICVAINYRLSPKARFPEHLLDSKNALRWIVEHIADYGGDADFIAATGGSAGGHLSSLLALTGNRHQQLLQPGFEQVDTSIRACVPFYGVYDFIDRNGVRANMDSSKFYANYIMPCPPAEDPQLWDLASPITQVNSDAPPFMVVHGDFDSLSYVEEGRHFNEALNNTSKNPLVYVELPGTQHAFEFMHSPRTEHAINATQQFLEIVYSDYLNQKHND